MNAIKLLVAEHKKMKKLVAELAKTSEKALQKRKKLFGIIKVEAKLHEKMEEKYLFPFFKEDKKSRPNAFEHHAEVLLLEHMIVDLSKTKFNSEEWTAKFTVFKEFNDHHIEEEEDEKFPQAIKLLSKDQLNQIGDEMLLFKKKHQK